MSKMLDTVGWYVDYIVKLEQQNIYSSFSIYMEIMVMTKPM